MQVQHGATFIAPLDEASKDVLRDGLYTPGELLRINQIVPDTTLFGVNRARQIALFDTVAG